MSSRARDVKVWGRGSVPLAAAGEEVVSFTMRVPTRALEEIRGLTGGSHGTTAPWIRLAIEEKLVRDSPWPDGVCDLKL